MVENKPRILIVEDHPETRIMLQMALEEQFELIVFAGANEALGELGDRRVDACLLDISLREAMDGVDLMRELRNLRSFSDVPMVAMTAYYWDEDGQALLDEGFQRFLQKPFVPDELTDMLFSLTRETISD